MKKKLTAIVLASVLAGALLAGCGTGAAPAPQEAKEETAAEEAETPEETPEAEAPEAEAPEAEAPEAEAPETGVPEAEAGMSDEEAAADAAAKIDAIYVQARTETTDADIQAARDAWNALTDAQKEMVEGEFADPDYFGRDTGDASLDDPRNGDEIGENELLVVSFGTSFNESRAMDIGGIEAALQEAYPDWAVRRAFTAQIIINHVQARDEEVIDNVEQALARAKANGGRSR